MKDINLEDGMEKMIKNENKLIEENFNQYLSLEKKIKQKDSSELNFTTSFSFLLI